jgi:hypothetical protein
MDLIRNQVAAMAALCEQASIASERRITPRGGSGDAARRYDALTR